MDADLERARAQWRHRGTSRPPWAIEPGPGQESVWDYPRPPRLEEDGRIVRVTGGQALIAETKSAIRVLETASPPTFYIPRQDVDLARLIQSEGTSHCEWKGAATYWSLRTNAASPPVVGWSYEDPYPEFEAMRGFLSFYPMKLQCFVGGVPVTPQPGGFYGGWVTPEVVGPFKGEPGTGAW